MKKNTDEVSAELAIIKQKVAYVSITLGFIAIGVFMLVAKAFL